MAIVKDADVKRVLVPGYDDVDLLDLPLVVIDFETSGLSSTNDRIVEYGFAWFDKGKCTAQIGGFVNPDVKLTEEVQKIHGITDADLEHAPHFPQVFRLLRAALKDRVPVAYNAPFDRRFLISEVGRMVVPSYEIIPAFLNETAWIDPLVWARHFYRHKKGRKLTDMCELLEVKLDDAHRAVSDAKATGEVLMKLAPKIGKCTYSRLIQSQQGNQ